MTDFIVIGGGIAGVSIAARLAPHGHVVVLEAESALGYHASGRSAALFEENYGPPAVKELNRASLGYLREHGYLSPRGFLLTARDDEMDAFAGDMAALGCEEITLDEARGKVPILGPAVRRAAYHGAAEDIDTDRMIQDFARVVRGHGGEVRLGARVRTIRKTERAWHVATDTEEISAALLVNAAGAWADDIARLAGVRSIGFQPCRRSMARLPAPPGENVQNWPMFFGAGERWYAKPDAGKLLVSPADEDVVPAQDAWPDDMVLAEGLARYEASVSVPVTRVETRWAGLRTFSPDRVPVLGRDADVPDFVWCAGQGGYGFQSAAGASQYLADHILGRVSDVSQSAAQALDPARFGQAQVGR